MTIIYNSFCDSCTSSKCLDSTRKVHKFNIKHLQKVKLIVITSLFNEKLINFIAQSQLEFYTFTNIKIISLMIDKSNNKF